MRKKKNGRRVQLSAGDPNSQRPPADRLIDQASAGIAALSRRYQEELIRAITASDPRALSSLAIRLDRIAEQFSAELNQALYDSQVAGYVVGASGAIAPLASAAGLQPLSGIPPITSDPLKIIYPAGGPTIEFPVIDKAIAALQDAGVMMPADYYSLSAQARRDAFTISADVTEKTIADIQEILSSNVSAGTSRQQFMDDVAKQVSNLPISEAHLEQVFRNNVNGAYSDGAEAVLSDPMVDDAFPYRAYYPIRDDRARETHLILETSGLDGTNVYHSRDPVWLMFRPPWDWNCRCGWTPLTIRRAANKGVRFAMEWLKTGVEPPDQFVNWPTLHGKPFLPSPSWQRISA